MPVDVIWDSEDRSVLRYVIVAPWTWNEFWTAFSIGNQLIDAVDYRVDHIVEADLALRSAPPGMFLQLRNIYRNLHPRRGSTALIATRQSAARTIWFRMALAVYPSARKEFIFTDSLEDARYQLARRREISTPRAS